MSDQPTYLQLLRGIANAESDAHCYLSAWRDTTTDTGSKTFADTPTYGNKFPKTGTGRTAYADTGRKRDC